MDSMYSLGTHRVSRGLPGDALRDGSDREKFREEFSIVDDLDALSAVSRFSRTHFDYQGHLEASSGHDCNPDREAGNFLLDRCRQDLKPDYYGIEVFIITPVVIQFSFVFSHY